MYSFETKIRVRYGETDQMKYAYYGIYAQYFEVGRVELLRSLGISYKKLEEEGYFLPVVNFKIHYKKPAFYDDKLTIETTIKVKPSVKIIFNYKTYNENGELLNTAETTLVFIDVKTRKPCQAPELLLNKFKKEKK
jgi:acyl-CoA thioester hydrolase